MSTVLVTGCSSGFGLAICRHFLAQGWDVVATMRHPDTGLLPASPRLRVLPLDVTDADSIARAVAAAGPLDALVNNAGVGLLNALEGTSLDNAREVFATNTLGTIAVTQAVLPQFRAQNGGVVVNVSSSVTLRPLRLLSVYSASKAAVNAFSAALALEVEPFGVRVRVVLPGAAPDTAFGRNARARMGMDVPAPYADMAAQMFAERQHQTAVTHATDVADAVWRAVTDPNCPPRLPAGADAREWFAAAEPGLPAGPG